LCFSFGLSAQHLPLYSAQNDHIGVVNPAGLNQDQMIEGHYQTFGASFRRQWLQFDNGPITQFIRGDYIFHNGSTTGLIFGGHLINDRTGPTGFTGAFGRFGAFLSDDPHYGGVGLALHGGLVQYRVNVSDIRLRDLDDVLIGNDKSELYPDLGVGLFAWKKLSGGFFDDAHVYGGVSVPQILGLDLAFETENEGFSLKRVQHLYATAGCYKPLEDNRFLQLSAWGIYAPGAPIRADLNIRFQATENFWVGAGGSSSGAIQLETGIVTFPTGDYDRRLRIGYLFEYSFQTFGPDAGSSHQLQLVYSLEP
ncbi:MAG: type IX secretion system membrane protein PorP/SprF, partial [Saprospiraceae bacterium]|nr:type IX secretion system membrane protein PorP/SprF [Saprospiraceae bacterium]